MFLMHVNGVTQTLFTCIGNRLDFGTESKFGSHLRSREVDAHAQLLPTETNGSCCTYYLLLYYNCAQIFFLTSVESFFDFSVFCVLSKKSK